MVIVWLLCVHMVGWKGGEKCVCAQSQNMHMQHNICTTLHTLVHILAQTVCLCALFEISTLHSYYSISLSLCCAVCRLILFLLKSKLFTIDTKSISSVGSGVGAAEVIR